MLHTNSNIKDIQNYLSSPILKRSISIGGHSTSVTLEQPFWDVLAKIASIKNIPISRLIQQIDDARSVNLSSALRLYVLYFLTSESL